MALSIKCVTPSVWLLFLILSVSRRLSSAGLRGWLSLLLCLLQLAQPVAGLLSGLSWLWPALWLNPGYMLYQCILG